MPVDAIEVEEAAGFFVDFAGCEAVGPDVEEFFVWRGFVSWEGFGGREGSREGEMEGLTHAPRPTLCHFPQTAKDGQFLVRHAHIHLIRLDIRLDGLQFRSRCRGEEIFENRKRETVLCKRDEPLQIRLRYPANGVYIGGRAVVFSHIAAQTLIHVSAT